MAKKIEFDFEAIKVRILEYLSSQSEWASFLNYGVIDNLISAIANEMAYQIQYSEYNSMENFWNMARNRSSLLQMSPMHGYIIPRKQASEGVVRISTSETFDSSYSTNIPIPQFFQFSGSDIYVCAKQNVILNADENYLDVNCVQGEAKELSFLAEGIKFEEKTIYDDSIDNSFFVLTVNDEVWENVSSLFLYNSEDSVFQIRTLPNMTGITLRFGNGIFGKKLNKNDVVKFKYISTKGSQGNIFSSNIIDTVENQAFDFNGNEVKLYCSNISTFIGGKDYPSLEEIRELSPKVYQTGNRASSKQDYISILKQNNRLSKISVWGAYETLKDRGEDPWGFIETEENVVHLALLIGSEYKSFDDLPEEQAYILKNEIVTKLYELCDPTDLINFESTFKIPMIFHVKGTMTSSAYTTAEVENNIKSNLSSEYGIKNMDFGESVYESDYVRLIDETDGIKNHISHVELYKDNITFSSSGYYCDFELPIFPINYEEVFVYIKDKTIENSDYTLMATCDANGNLIGADKTSYIMTNSTLDLNNGKGKISVTNGLDAPYNNYLIKVSYQYDGQNIYNNNRKNILYYENTVVDLTY